MEQWEKINGFDGMYSVSTQGRVKSIRFGKEKIIHLRLSRDMKYNIVVITEKGKRCVKTVHQLMAIAFLNHTPCGRKIVVDHINNVSLDNRIENLQLITHRENLSKDKKGTSKYVGVCWCKTSKKWRSAIRINGKVKYLGMFTDELEASNTYQVELDKIKKGVYETP